MERVLGMNYVDQYYTTFPGGVPRHIARTIDDSPSAAKYHSLACIWYDMLKPDIADPFYIACSADGCVLHVDHSESTGWPCILVIELEDECERELLPDVLQKVCNLKHYIFDNLLSKEDASHIRGSNTAISLSCPGGPYAGFILTIHSRSLGTFEGYVISSVFTENNAFNTKCIKDKLQAWRILCDTHSLGDLKSMPR